jgi:23S rRNA pseudouridine1911/1915/1917 synthase
MPRKILLSKKVLPEDSGQRLDALAAKYFPEFSRAHIQRWVKDGSLLLDNKKVKPRQSVNTDDLITIEASEEIQLRDLPEQIDLDVIWEDKEVLVLNKPAGLVVHPGAGNANGTLVNGLLNYSSDQGFLPRAGIVHRLDKDTSGIMVVAKTEVSYLNLVGQLKERTVKRHYLALVVGQPVSGGVINKPIGRHPKHRTKQAVVETGKEAITEYKIKEKLCGYSLLLASLKTGRTHQIRVHFSSKDFPIVGDPLYGGKRKFALGTSENLKKEISELNRQALHAYSLSFIHPVDQNIITNTAPMPNDMKKLIENLRQHASSS